MRTSIKVLLILGLVGVAIAAEPAKRCPGCWGKVATCLVCKRRAQLGMAGDNRWFWCKCGGKMKRSAAFHKNSHEQKIAVCNASPYFGYPQCGHGMGAKPPGREKKPDPEKKAEQSPVDAAIAQAQTKVDTCKTLIAKHEKTLKRLKAELAIHQATLEALKKVKAGAGAAAAKGTGEDF